MGWLRDFVSDPIGTTLGTVNDVIIDPVVDVVGDAYMAIRDPIEAAATIVGNYYFPGSSIITSHLVSDGAKEYLNTPAFRIANLASSMYGASDGNYSNYGFNSASEAEAAYQADLEAVNPPELLGEAGGNTFALDTAQEGLIPLGDAAGVSAAEVTAAKTAMVEKGLTFSQAMNYVRGGLLVNALTGDPLGLGGSKPSGGGGGATGFDQVPIPAEWRSPTYSAPSAPIDLSSIFTDQNLLAGTQWQGLPTQQPNVSFNDIFASGQQQTPMGNMVDINQIVSSILGQNTASQKSS